MNTIENIEIQLGENPLGKTYKIFLGKNGLPASRSKYGKMLLIQNKIELGYGKVTEILRSSHNYDIVNMENVIYDYYTGMGYNDFMELLKVFDYIIGFDHVIVTTDMMTNQEYFDHHIMAFKPSTGVIIVAETEFGGLRFNTVQVYCPNVDHTKKYEMFQSFSNNMIKLELCKESGTIEPFHYIEDIMLESTGPTWDFHHNLTLVNSVDIKYNDFVIENRWGFDGSRVWNETIERLLECPSEIETILYKCEKLKPIFDYGKRGLDIDGEDRHY